MRRRLTIACTIVLAISALCCSDGRARNKTLVSWRDPTTGARFTVTARKLLVDYVTEFHVERGGIRRMVFIDDKIRPQSISFARAGDWLLVLNGPHVLSVYNFSNDRVLGGSDSEHFPFTHRPESAVVVTTRTIHPSETPRGLRHAARSAGTAPSTPKP